MRVWPLGRPYRTGGVQGRVRPGNWREDRAIRMGDSSQTLHPQVVFHAGLPVRSSPFAPHLTHDSVQLRFRAKPPEQHNQILESLEVAEHARVAMREPVI